MTFDPIDDKGANRGVAPVEKAPELQDLNFADLDLDEIERKASIFVEKTKFVPVGESVKLVSVEKNGKIIYEDDGIIQLADSQAKLAEMKYDFEEDNSAGFLGGFFGKSKSMFNKKQDNFV